MIKQCLSTQILSQIDVDNSSIYMGMLTKGKAIKIKSSKYMILSMCFEYNTIYLCTQRTCYFVGDMFGKNISENK
jgi:hypothetical protein